MSRKNRIFQIFRTFRRMQRWLVRVEQCPNGDVDMYVRPGGERSGILPPLGHREVACFGNPSFEWLSLWENKFGALRRMPGFEYMVTIHRPGSSITTYLTFSDKRIANGFEYGKGYSVWKEQRQGRVFRPTRLLSAM